MPSGKYAHKKGIESHRWKGGEIKRGDYVGVYEPTHPRATTGAGCYIQKHVLIAEKAYGALLPVGAIVHHVNEDKKDNRNENLVICENAAYHSLLHQRLRAFKATGNAEARTCSLCKQWEHDLTTGAINSRAFRHRVCHAQYMHKLKLSRR